MKPILLIISIFISSQAISQHIQYTYDPNGNRDHREYVPMKVRNTAVVEDSTRSDIQYGINVFPNPAKDILNVSIALLDDKSALLKLTDENGRVLETKTQNSTQIEFDISAYRAGVYYLIVFIEKKSTSYKILKM